MRIETSAVNYYASMNINKNSDTKDTKVSKTDLVDATQKSIQQQSEIPGAADYSVKMDSQKVYFSNDFGDTAEISRSLMDIDQTLGMLGISQDNEFKVNKRVDGTLNVMGNSSSEAMRLEHYLNA